MCYFRFVTIKNTSKRLPPEIHSFTDYREYLRALYAHFKKNDPRFSHRFFSKMAGLGGQSYLRMVMTGQRNLSQKSASSFARAFGLGRSESRYFEALVYYNQAITDDEKNHYQDIMMGLRPKTRMRGLEKDQYEYFTDNLYVVLREMTALPDFNEDPQWIAQALRSHPMTTQITAALKTLERLKLLVRDKSGKLKHSGKTLKNPPEIPSAEVLNYHRHILSQGRDLIMTSPRGEWDLLSITLPIRKESIRPVMEILKRAAQEVVDHVNQGNKKFEEVYQLNMQFFPMTQVSKSGKKPGE